MAAVYTRIRGWRDGEIGLPGSTAGEYSEGLSRRAQVGQGGIMRMRALTSLLAGLCLLAACGGGGTAPPRRAETGGIKIGLLLDDLRQERWKRDRDLFVSRVEELHGKVDVRTGEGSADTQLKAANELLDAGVKVLVVVPNDLEKAVAIVDAAAAKKVPVISYDRLIRDADVALYVSFDNVKVGRMQAEALLTRAPRGNYVLLGGAQSDNNARLLRDGQLEVLKPAVSSGAVKIVADPWIDRWDEAAARTEMTSILKKTKNIVAVVASNDSIAKGAIDAIAEAKLAGKVAVSGQDAEVGACQRIVAGTQTMTVYKPLKPLARMAAGAAWSLANGQPIDSLVKMNNGKKDVPARLLDPISVEKANLDVTVVSDGYHTHDEVYGGK
jgi:D-xylose transport system substrate-binding protein